MKAPDVAQMGALGESRARGVRVVRVWDGLGVVGWVGLNEAELGPLGAPGLRLVAEPLNPLV